MAGHYVMFSNRAPVPHCASGSFGCFKLLDICVSSTHRRSYVVMFEKTYPSIPQFHRIFHSRHVGSTNPFLTMFGAHNEAGEVSEPIQKTFKCLICKHKGWSGAFRISWRPMKVLRRMLGNEQKVVRCLPVHGGEGEDLSSNIEAATTANNLNEANDRRLPVEIIIGASVLSVAIFALIKSTIEVTNLAWLWSIISPRSFKFLESNIRKTLATLQGTLFTWISFVTTLLTISQHLRSKVALFDFKDMRWSWSRLSYMLDVLLERHPISYILLLSVSCIVLICLGGLLFNKYRRRNQKIEDSLWDAWACICSSSTHLKEETGLERMVGIMLAVGGLLFYSLLTSTLTAQFKSHMEWLREGAHSQVMESGHIVICGENNHLSTVLKQLNASHEFAIRDRNRYARKQTVLLLSERPRRDTEKLASSVHKDCPKLDILSRSGSLSSPSSFQKVAAEKAKSVVFLANKDDSYEADADAILSVLAIQSVLENSSGDIVVEVSNSSTGDLLQSLTGMKVSPVQNLSSKLFVQCSRQQGLVDVYRRLLDHCKQVINLRNYPSLAGLQYQEIRRGFPEAIVCGMIRNGDVEFHPKELEVVQSSDKLLIIAPKHTHRNPPEALLASSISRKSVENTFQHAPDKLVTSESKPSKSVPNIVKKSSVKTAEWRKTLNERILILGWKVGVCDMMLEYDNYVGPGSELGVCGWERMPGPGPHLMYSLGVGTGIMHLSKGRFTPYHCLVYAINAFLGPDLGSFSEWLTQTSGVGKSYGSQIMSIVHHPFYYILLLGLPLSILYSRLSKLLLQKGFFATTVGIRQCFYLIAAGCLSHFFLDNLFEENGKTPMMNWILSTGWWDGRAPISTVSVVVVGLLCTSLLAFFINLNRLGPVISSVRRVRQTFISLGVIAVLYCLWCASQIYLPEHPHPAVGEEADLGVLVFLTLFFFLPHGLCVYSMHPIDIIEDHELLPTFEKN